MGTDGTTVGNPKPTQLRFNPFESGLVDVEICLTNILLRLADLPDEPPIHSIAGFNTFYYYFDPTEQRRYINALVEKPLRLDPGGTLIGNFEIPQARYDRVAFGFTQCATASAGIHLINANGEYADTPQGFFALVYDGVRDLHSSAGRLFEIEFFTKPLATVSSQNDLLQLLQPYRRFDAVGFTRTLIPNHNSVLLKKLANQSSGKTIAFGSGNMPGAAGSAIVARYNPDGQLDKTFGDGRFVPGLTILQQGDKYLRGISGVVAPDDSLFVIAHSPPDTAILKLTSNGKLDPSFGVNGKIAVDLGGVNEYPQDAIIESSGKITFVGVNEFHQLLVVRLLANGAPDPIFGERGIVKINFVGYGYDDPLSVRLQTNNKLVISASINEGVDVNWMAFRLNQNGSLDTTFNPTGKKPGYFTHNFGFNTRSFVYSHMAQPDGKIVLVGSGAGQMAALRLMSNGTLDQSFASNGVFTRNFGKQSSAKDVLIDSRGNIIITGDTILSENIFSFALISLGPNGALNASEQDPGFRIYSLNPGAQGQDMIQRRDGNIYLGGSDSLSFNLLTIAK
ncbi:MAG: hypothetical protein AB7N80_01040 [Bdellovibrionales bacterium]